jgi:hypothetical protein
MYPKHFIYICSTNWLGALLAELVQYLPSKCEALISSRSIHDKDMYSLNSK